LNEQITTEDSADVQGHDFLVTAARKPESHGLLTHGSGKEPVEKPL